MQFGMRQCGVRWRRWWNSQGGPAEVLRLAVPLVLSTGSLTIQVFIDRLFLTWYSQAAIAAVVPAMCVFWVFFGGAQGVVSFATTFVAQYHGAAQHKRIGAVVGQSVLLSLLGGVSFILLWPLAGPFFEWVGHEPTVQALEMTYLQIMLVGAPAMLVTVAVSSFFSGLGRTWVVLWLNLLMFAVNAVLDYLWIFGKWGFPELGVAGAAWATVLGYVAAAVLGLVFLWAADPEDQFGLRRAASWKPETEMLWRMLRYGGPNGFVAVIDVLGWTWFILLVGRLGTVPQAATNVAVNINLLAFLPMVGLSTATQALVGQRLGENRPDLARRCTWSAFWLAFVFMGTNAVGYVLVPDLFLAPFRWHTPPAEYAAWRDLVVGLLRFVALFTLFDMTALILCGALRGAGDTRFVLGAILVLCTLVLGVPSYVAFAFWNGGIYAIWTCATAYVLTLGVAMFIRFQSGVWQRLRVIESAMRPLASEEPVMVDGSAIDSSALAVGHGENG